jgi:hypothetical protein
MSRWPVTDRALDAAAILTTEITANAREQGHGLVSMSLRFADGRLLVAVVDEATDEHTTVAAERVSGGKETLILGRERDPGVAGPGCGRLRWFELRLDEPGPPG